LTWKVLPNTQRTIDLVKRVRARNPAVGTVIQSYLYRSETDVTDLLSYGCRIRLCKGAYKESVDVAYPRKEDVDANFVRLMQHLLDSGFYHGIATHDPRMIAATISPCGGQANLQGRFRISDAVWSAH